MNDIETGQPNDASEASHIPSDSMVGDTRADAMSSAPLGFQIGMRQMLIALLAVGSGIGLWGRLFLSAPEIALVVLSAGSVMLPFLVAIALLFRLAKRAESPATVRVMATALLLTPVFGLGAGVILQQMHFSRVGPTGLAGKSNAELIETELPAKVDEPWVWDELERRLAISELSPEESADAIGVLVAKLRMAPNGYDQPLSWQGDFVRQALAKGMDQELAFQIYEAYIPPDAVTAGRVRETNRRLNLDVEFVGTWADNLGLGFTLLSEVLAVRINGKTAEFETDFRSREDQSIVLKGPFARGEMQVEIDVAYAFVSDDDLVGLSWESLSSKEWPQPLKAWTATHAKRIPIVGANEKLVELIEGVPKPQIRVQRLLVQSEKRASRDRPQTTLKVIFEPITYDLPVAFQVIATAGDRRFEFPSRLTAYSTSEYSSSRDELQIRLAESLPPDIQSLDLQLVPSPRTFDSEPDVKKMFGEELNYYSVPLERFDLGGQD